jgi:hypothetical protein
VGGSLPGAALAHARREIDIAHDPQTRPGECRQPHFTRHETRHLPTRPEQRRIAHVGRPVGDIVHDDEPPARSEARGKIGDAGGEIRRMGQRFDRQNRVVALRRQGIVETCHLESAARI